MRWAGAPCILPRRLIMDRKMTSPVSTRGIPPQTSVQLKELLDASPDIISLIDAEEWCVKYQNAAGDGVLGNIVGKHCYESIAKLPNNCPFCKAPEALATGKTTKAELPLADGKWLLIQYAPVRKGEKLLVAETITDITEQKQLQEEYRKIKDELADLNRSLEERIEQQVAELEKLGKLKRFLSPPVAELILSGAAGDPFKTRRGKVTILFLDLRGFTSFAEMGEPEEVMEVLQNYHSQVGRLIQEY